MILDSRLCGSLRSPRDVVYSAKYTPLFNKFICATLPESTPPSFSEYTPLFNNSNIMRPFQNLPLPLSIYPPFQQIYMCDPPRIYPSLPEDTPLSTTICDPPRIYLFLPKYTPFLTNLYVRSSQKLLLPPRIYPLFNNCMRPFQNLPLPPRIYPPFQQLFANLPESTPPFQNIAPFSTNIILCDPPRIFYRKYITI